MSFLHCWDWTLQSTDGDAHSAISEWLKGMCSKWVFQYEEGLETKNLHYQGRNKFVKGLSLKQINNYTAGSVMQGAHWSPTVTKVTNNFDYCMKKISRVAGPWMDVVGLADAMPPDLVGLVLRPYQKEIKDICTSEKWTRLVHVIVDIIGGLGKSTLARIADYEEWAGWIPAYEDMKDMLQTVYGTGARAAYIIDMPRGAKAFKMWSGIEQIKNGTIIDARHKFKKLRIPIPVVFVFTNQFPDLTLLSPDRWKIWHIDEMHLTPWGFKHGGVPPSTLTEETPVIGLSQELIEEKRNLLK